MAKLKKDPITAQDLTDFVNADSDFGFEMRVLKRLRREGFTCSHSGTYRDPVTDKIRQYDIRAQKDRGDLTLALAVECKNLRPNSPLLLSAVPRNPIVVHAAFEAFRKLGAEVKIAEGPGHRRATLDLAAAAGYFGTVPKFEDAFTDLNLDNVSRRTIPRPVSQLKSLYLPHTVLDCDLLVSLPKMKTHHWAGATLAMKNLFGLVPGGIYGWPKNVLHWAGIPEMIVDLHHLFPRQFAIVDGIVGMEGNGPIQGTPKQAGVLVAGSDVAAVDATCCRIMGIDPKKIEYLRLARGEENLGESAFRQIGEPISAVYTPFHLIDPWREMIQAT